ncbi:CMGC/CLK protein kinase [Aspergillus pseudodeflectus]|uniref:CMGC/CLK protein kinase n=1 Tax=Aspergillus pseudodeflectus TaxID=176178 RepID=A0ABR4KBY9_9EURO
MVFKSGAASRRSVGPAIVLTWLSSSFSQPSTMPALRWSPRGFNSVVRSSLARYVVSPLHRSNGTTVASKLLLPQRQFLTSGFVKVDISRKIEEEELPLYKAENYYPASIGQVLESRYQIVSKLGYGTSSTVWLCRDLREDDYLTLKVCNKGHEPTHELAISDLLRNSKEHAGKKTIRLVLDSFKVSGPSGTHTCLIYQPCGMSFTEFQHLLPDNKLPKELVQRGIQLILISLAFLHDNGVIHTDISTNNILQVIQDPSILRQIEEDEVARPIARKVLSDRTIYFSRPMPNSTGLPVLSDFGEARIDKGSNRGDIMPGIYRAPEVILDMEWDCKVDVWSIGTMIWDMVEGGHLFFAKKDRILNDEQHLAELVSLMGSPPEFLQRSEKCRQFWDDQGSIPIPEQSFEMRARQFPNEDNELFMAFLRRIFRWLPEERPTAEELAYDDFLMQPLLVARLAG